MFHSNLTEYDEIPFWPSVADIAFSVAILMILYVLAQFAASSEKIAATVELQRRQNQIQMDVHGVIPLEIRNDMTVSSDGNLQHFAFSDRILFESGSAELNVAGQRLVRLVGDAIKQHLDLFCRIQVEGHTDAVPLRGSARFASNWELSSARATAVVRFLHEQCRIEPSLLSAVGLSRFHPVDTHDSPEARRKNRRIELVLVYSTRMLD